MLKHCFGVFHACSVVEMSNPYSQDSTDRSTKKLFLFQVNTVTSEKYLTYFIYFWALISATQLRHLLDWYSP